MWNLLGFKENILFNSPIEIEEKAPDLLAGRDNELIDFAQEILSNETCIKIVTGKAGVGKTSFLNVLQYLFYKKSDYFKNLNIYKQILPNFHRVELVNKDNLETVLEKILKSLSKNIRDYYAENPVAMPREIKDLTNYWIGLKDEETTTERDLEINAGIIKIGTKTSVTEILINKQDAEYSFEVLLKLLRKNTDFEGAFILFDNLENLTNDNIIRILNEIRDKVLIKKHMYYLLISSDTQILSNIHSGAKRLSGIINPIDIELKALSNNQILYAIEERLNIFKQKKSDVKLLPFAEYLLYQTYAFTDYELRETFNILNYICQRAFSIQQVINDYNENKYQISYVTGIDFLIEYCEKIHKKFDLFNLDRLRLAIIYTSDNYHFASLKFKNKKELNLYLESLCTQNLLEKHRKEDTIVYKKTFKFEMMAVANKITSEIKEKAIDKILPFDSI